MSAFSKPAMRSEEEVSTHVDATSSRSRPVDIGFSQRVEAKAGMLRTIRAGRMAAAAALKAATWAAWRGRLGLDLPTAEAQRRSSRQIVRFLVTKPNGTGNRDCLPVA
jgi:hypothetical protein